MDNRLRKLEEHALRMECLRIAREAGIDPADVLAEVKGIIWRGLSIDEELQLLVAETGQPYEQLAVELKAVMEAETC